MQLKTVVPAVLMAVSSAAYAGNNPGFVDAFYVPKTDAEVSAPGFGSASDDGDGFGVRGLLRAGEIVFFTGEYQTVEYDSDGSDFDQVRVGLGVMNDAGFGGYVEYLSGDLSGAFEASGFALHGRAAGEIAPNFELYGDIGYLMLENEYDDTGGFSEDSDGFEFTLGAAFAVSQTLGLFLDYRRTTFEGDDTQIEFETSDVRAGVRFRLGN